jgi:aquaporin Z
VNRLIAEAIGTFFLVFAGTGAIVVNQVYGGAVTHVGIALTFGLVVMSMIYALGDTSGAHLNPAVTTAFWVARKFPGGAVPGYLVAQCSGALAASGALRVIVPASTTLGATLPSGTWGQSFIMEVILTCMLMLVILQVSSGSKEKGILAGVAIGGVVALEALFAGPICGASMNPARSLAPAIVSGHIESLWIYVTAPVLGAAIAVPLASVLRAPPVSSSSVAT